MRAIRLALFFAVGLILGGGAVAAFAAVASGNVMQWVGASGMVWKARDGSIRSLSNPYWEGFSSGANGGVLGKLGQKATLQGGGSLVIDIGRQIPASTIGRLGAQLAKVGGPAAIGLTLAPLVWDAAQGWMNPAPVEEACPQGVNCQRYWFTTLSTATCRGVGKQCSYTTAYDEALAWLATLGTQVQITGTTIGTCNAQTCDIQHTGTYLNWSGQPRSALINMSSGAVQGSAEPVSATDQEIADTIVAQGVEFDKMSDIAQRILESGLEDELIADAGPIETSGPASVSGGQTTSTTTTPQGTSTTTTNVTHNVTYNSNVINISTTTTSTTIHPDGTQSTTEQTETAPDNAQQEEQQYTLDYTKPAPLEVPDFYEQQYPDGFAGEWEGFRDRVAASSLAGFINSLSNGVPAGGECPAWAFNLNMGAMGNFGTFTMQPPCIIWPFIKTVLILTALFVARRMVVGG